MNTIRRLLLILSLCLALLLTSGTAQFNFVHISDIHVSDVASIQNSPDIGGVIFKQVINKIKSLIPKPAFVVASGDNSNVGSYGTGMYETLTQHLFPAQISNPANGDYFIDSAQTIPIYFTPGNHDYFTLPASPLSNADLVNYTNFLSPNADYSITYENAVLLFVRSGMEEYRPVWVDTNPLEPEGSGISNDQCNFIRTSLNLNSDKKKFIIMHHPPVNAVGTNANGTPSTGTVLDPADGSIINNRDVLLNICDSAEVDMVLAGHVHQSLVADRDGNIVNENFTGGTRYIQTAASLYGAYRVITVDSSLAWAGETQSIYSSTNAETFEKNSAELFDVYFNSYQQTININVLNFENTSNAKICLFDIAGKKVFQQDETLYSGKMVILNTSICAKGIYLLSIVNSKSIFTKKIAIN
jgi:3',5'-cyclic AMP phosphodiesterase CpdA